MPKVGTKPCPFCAMDVPPGIATCPNCGGAIPAAAQTPSPHQYGPSPPAVAMAQPGTAATAGRSSVLVAAMVIMLLVAGGGVFFMLSAPVSGADSAHRGVEEAVVETPASSVSSPPGPGPTVPGLPGAAAAGAAAGLSEPQARVLAAQHYATRGEWAGQYAMSIARVRLVPTGPSSYEGHVQYQYTCIRARCDGASQGMDQRIFYFQRTNAMWQVSQMGGHMSASF